ncbi:acetyl-CoA carboxylase carboxyltransferase subunit alpha [candidate division WOR-3 bacterium]|nr:acetyl-CoA carboxylase carboxyltransferase subunit alpha [candidate division WOR-3 bacterium]
MTRIWLEFERPIADLERKIEELQTIASDESLDVSEEIEKLKAKSAELKKQVYSNLTPWQRVQLARHLNRPYLSDYIKLMFTDFLELHGDGCFRDDPAMIAGIGKIDGKSVVLVGHEKGRKTKDKLYRNFGMAHPEGYRKALRVMKIGEKFGKPIISLIDTPGAYPGIGAEERGQAQAIAQNIKAMSTLRVPIIVIVTGEGGSGGALGIGVGDIVLVQEYAFYSVISPEGCASILWRDAKKAPDAAEALHITAQDLLKLKVIDGIIKEPEGGAHRDYEKSASILKQTILENLNHLSSIPPDALIEKRLNKFESMGIYKKT